MQVIQLSKKDVFAVVDDCDYDYLVGMGTWHLISYKYAGCVKYSAEKYRRTGNGNVMLYMHRVIAERFLTEVGKHVDHIDGDPLNNTRENLRSCSHSLNLMNSGKRRNNTSGYKGVYAWRGRGKKPWKAEIRFEKKRYHLGYFETAEEASKAYDKKFAELCGELIS